MEKLIRKTFISFVLLEVFVVSFGLFNGFATWSARKQRSVKIDYEKLHFLNQNTTERQDIVSISTYTSSDKSIEISINAFKMFLYLFYTYKCSADEIWSVKSQLFFSYRNCYIHYACYKILLSFIIFIFIVR